MTPAGEAIESFALRDGPSIELDPAGFVHPRGSRSADVGFTRYVEITHVAVSERAIWIATEDDLIVVPSLRFVDADGASRLREALLARVARLPDGDRTLARMAELDAIGVEEGPHYAVNALAAVCVAAFVAELVFRPEVLFVGQFSPRLAQAGDLWRLVTGNLLHGNLWHLGANLFGLFVLGRVVERDLGTLRTLCVMGVSALAAMLLSGLFADEEVVGVSGVVLGMGGSLLWVELRHRNEQPAWFRFARSMRQLLIVALAADLVLGFFVPFIAGAAHLGGLLGGAAATAGLTHGGLRRATRPLDKALAVGVVACVAGAVVWAGAELAAGQYVARHIERLSELPGVSVNELNQVAWHTAIDEDSTKVELLAALDLAELAVRETGGLEPSVIDTLAEVQFALQRPLDAIASIDQAIALAPDVSYFREQRRRYTGERPAHDRPPDPSLPPPRRRVPALPLDEALQGVTE